MVCGCGLWCGVVYSLIIIPTLVSTWTLTKGVATIRQRAEGASYELDEDSEMCLIQIVAYWSMKLALEKVVVQGEH